MKLGSASSGRTWRADVRLVREAIDHGITVFDTADAYGSGASERVLGHALGGRRSSVTIATKGGYRFRSRTFAEQEARRLVSVAQRAAARGRATATAGSRVSGATYVQQDFSADYLRRAVEASLRRLRTDHIDVYQLHGPHEVLPELFQELEDLVRDGKVGRFGVGAESVDEAAAWIPMPGVSVAQLPFGILDPEAADGVLEAADAHDVQIWARGVLGGGLLDASLRDPGFDDPKLPLIRRLQEVADRHGVELDRLAIGFVQSVPAPSTMIVGVNSTIHLHRYLELMAAGPLDAELLEKVRAVLDQAGNAGG